ncbi:PD-(D/E)XK nuclease family protein [Paenibacillus lignilyticus]|uniref:PD-(D/E)XK nuclease family protein n=1 Tax=Paenibacillus lignilyticus TaxID=1172615 RepID=A0ABS5CK53_9BACL|nr:PD-(D/E)XK nuclease family protein [Paenibacillus lignilyticus]MBP3966258.1 PD-(D/E)XK nuclease family protein [Paenibacillus lignilyticus]
MNTEIETIKSLITKRSKQELVKQEITLLSGDQTFWLINNLMLEIAQHYSEYLPVEMITSGIVQSFHDAIQELREADLRSSELTVEQFESKQKGLYMLELLSAYENRLKDGKFTDFAGLLSYLPVSSGVEDELIITRDAGAAHSYIEREMLDRVAGPRLHVIQEESRFPESLYIQLSTKPEIFQAAGSMAEVREVLRRVCSHEIPFDNVEVILSDYNLYNTVVHNISQSLDIPCTFSKGLSATFTQVGKAALAYLEWLARNYDVDCMLNALRHGFISFWQDESSVSSIAIIRCLEQSGIGWGRARYAVLQSVEGEDGTGADNAALRELNAIFSDLFTALPEEENWKPLIVLRGLIQFLDRCTAPVSVEDAAVLAVLREQADCLAAVNPQTVSSESAIRYVKEIVTGINIRSNSPRSGHIYISSLQDGGDSGRAHTFMIGMNESAWSVQTRQDPALFDMERANMGRLLTSVERAEERVLERNSRLGHISSHVTFSFCSYDPFDQKEEHAAFELLQVCREVSGNQLMDFTAMKSYLGKPVGYLPGQGDGSSHELDSSDRWLGRLTEGGRLSNGTSSLLHSYRFASKAYHDSTLGGNGSGQDGILDMSTFTIQYRGNSEAYLSVTQLERYAECPRRFFYSSILKIREKDTAVFDRSQWLGPADRGSLLHRIFYLYLKEAISLTDSGEPRHDRTLLMKITKETIQEYQVMVPPPSLHIFHKESEAIRKDVEVFYKVELERMTKPRYFELELEEEGGPLTVELENGLVIRLKGFVDRVDEIRPHHYKIFDYKTGRPSKYDENDYFAQGTQLQHALYAVAVEQWLRTKGIDVNAQVVESAYYFPTERGKGEEVSRIQDRRAELSKLLSSMLHNIESGVFVPTTEVSNCKWCDYREVCSNETALIEVRGAANYA